ncbi:hypothetical protein PENTCL1PPCAC_10808, partial [Pristionchus entomophagus]
LLVLPGLVAGVVAHDASLLEARVEVEGGVVGSVEVHPEAMGIGSGHSDDTDTVTVSESIDGDGHGAHGVEVFSGEV